MDCVNIGAIHFISCNNVITIRGVNWERCGSSNGLSYPGISFYKSSNVTIQNCSFNSSLAQAVVLSQVSGDLYINNSVFTHNAQHRGHGAAVQYTPESTTHTQTKLMINSCNFSYNGPAKSVTVMIVQEINSFSILTYKIQCLLEYLFILCIIRYTLTVMYF